jgi:lysophospholipase L1-like esterase
MSRLVAWSLAALLIALLAAPPASAQKRDLYVSLGDSWAMGVQPTGPGGKGRNTSAAIPDQLASVLRRRGRRVRVVKLGCGGATTTEMLRGRPDRSDPPCNEHTPVYRNRTPATSQVTYGERYLRRNRDRLALVTLVVSGNDLSACVRNGQVDGACLTSGLAAIRRNAGTIARRIRAAAGRSVPIVAHGYHDIFLGYWRSEPTRSLAELSQVFFRDQWMPALARAYRQAGVDFVDVASETDAYARLEGDNPANVALVCRETWFCERQDIHAKPAGYRRVAELIAAELPRRTATGRARRR